MECEVLRAKFTGITHALYLLVLKPEAQPLLYQMRFIEVLRHAQHAAHEEAADLDGGFADTTPELLRFLHDQYTDARIVPQQQGGRGRA